MDFLQEITNDHYSPIYLIQYDIARPLFFATTKYAFVYVTNFTNVYDWIPPEFTVGAEVASISNIGSVRMGGIILKQVFSFIDCALNRESFYFDVSTKSYYRHPPNGNNPSLFDEQIGIILGFRKGGDETNAYYNDIYYDDVVLSIPQITRSKADYFNARNVNEGGEIRIGNVNGEYDKLAEDVTILGNSVRIYVGFTGYSFTDFQIVSIGFAKRIVVGTDELVMQIQDKKERLNIPIPQNTFELADYAFLNENDLGKVIPLIYGECRNLPVVCVNEKQFDYDDGGRPAPPETLTFKIADMTNYASLHDVTKVYVYDGDGHKSDVTAFATISLTNGSFTLTSDYYVPGQTVTVDVGGYNDADGNAIANALDVMRELIVNNTAANFNNIYFNISRWEKSRAFNIGIAINESTTLIKAIEEITQKGTLANFQIDDDDRYSCRILNTASAVDLVLNEWDVFNDIKLEYDQEMLVAELEINYNKDWEKDEYSKYLDDTYKDFNNNNYQAYLKKSIETLLNNSTDAANFAYAFLDIFGDPYRTFDVITGLIACKQEISNIIQIKIKRPYAPNMGIAKCEVIKIIKNFDIPQITLGLRIFELVLPQIWSEGNDWYSGDWFSTDWAIGMYVPDLTA